MKYRSNARENQDLFILCALDGKRNGTYLEIGSYLPVEDSNTYLLESQFDWTGVSIEIVDRFVAAFNHARSNPCIKADGTILDYDKLIQENYDSTHIDYLQFDIDPAPKTLQALKSFDFDKYSFSIITFEHEGDVLYNDGPRCRAESRDILSSFGYTRVVSDVRHIDLAFEDWYVNEEYMSSDNWKKFIGDSTRMDTPSMSPETRKIFEDLLMDI